MKITNIKVPFYKWQVITIYLQSKKDFEPLMKKLKNTYELAEQHCQEMRGVLRLEPYDGARVFYNEGKLLILVVIYQHRSKKELEKTIIHEASHATDKIIESCGLEGTEARAYLNEYICFNMKEQLLANKKKG